MLLFSWGMPRFSSALSSIDDRHARVHQERPGEEIHQREEGRGCLKTVHVGPCNRILCVPWLPFLWYTCPPLLQLGIQLHILVEKFLRLKISCRGGGVGRLSNLRFCSGALRTAFPAKGRPPADKVPDRDYRGEKSNGMVENSTSPDASRFQDTMQDPDGIIVDRFHGLAGQRDALQPPILSVGRRWKALHYMLKDARQS